jgi:hypothetical protein
LFLIFLGPYVLANELVPHVCCRMRCSSSTAINVFPADFSRLEEIQRMHAAHAEKLDTRGTAWTGSNAKWSGVKWTDVKWPGWTSCYYPADLRSMNIYANNVMEWPAARTTTTHFANLPYMYVKKRRTMNSWDFIRRNVRYVFAKSIYNTKSNC